jgi:hypothetical protein
VLYDERGSFSLYRKNVLKELERLMIEPTVENSNEKNPLDFLRV